MRLFLALLFITAATVAQAAPFYAGVWVADGMGCKDGLRITETEMFGLENRCQLTKPVQIRGIDGVLFDRVCAGEGDSYTDRLLMLNEEGGRLTMFTNGYTIIYDRCP